MTTPTKPLQAIVDPLSMNRIASLAELILFGPFDVVRVDISSGGNWPVDIIPTSRRSHAAFDRSCKMPTESI